MMLYAFVPIKRHLIFLDFGVVNQESCWGGSGQVPPLTQIFRGVMESSNFDIVMLGILHKYLCCSLCPESDLILSELRMLLCQHD
jgi:hypothetical protein